MTSITVSGTYAVVLMVNGRYFSGFTRTGRMQSAWSLPGAKLFAAWRIDEIEKTEKKLADKGHRTIRVGVTVQR